MQFSTREELEAIGAQLKTKRQSFEPHWQSCVDFTSPHRIEIVPKEGREGTRMNQNIYDNTASLALRTGTSGMMSGITSPARPWKKLTTPDPDLAEFGRVKEWLHVVDQRMSNVFTRSNLYQTLPQSYHDLMNIATSAMIQDEDMDTVTNFTQFAPGTYWLGKDHRGRVNLFRREFRMTVRELIGKFGQIKNGRPDWSPFSERVKALWDENKKEAWIDVCHVIKPNSAYDAYNPFSAQKKFESVYYEKGACSGHSKGYKPGEQMLRRSGYDYFPILAPRWEIDSSSAYGVSCPTMLVLGEIRELQFLKQRKAESIDKMARPPMVGHPDLEQAGSSILPSETTYIDESDGQKRFRPAFELNPPLGMMLEDINDTRGIVKRGYFEDLFLMLSTLDRSQITAREIQERYEEKLLALGPVLEQMNTDLLNPLIDNTFDIMVRQGLIPPAPQELQGVNLRVEYVSVMHQAQKSLSLSGMDRLFGYVSAIQPLYPAIMDKFDADQFIDEAAESLGVSPRIIRSDEAVEGIRAEAAQAQAAQMQVMQAREQAAAAKDLSSANMEGDNALTRLVDQAAAGQMVPA